MNRKMMNICLLLLVVLVTVGCHVVKTANGYYEACKGDEACLQGMTSSANVAHLATSAAVNTIPSASGVAEVVGGVVGSIVAYFVGVLRGKRLVVSKGL